ncbi:MAG: hypothetical protein E5Y89_14280 [Mesorhizobium sp.]|nr:MAG: hypothetical protein E5Y89_14280 [Mesorhizobium sp.]
MLFDAAKARAAIGPNATCTISLGPVCEYAPVFQAFGIASSLVPTPVSVKLPSVPSVPAATISTQLACIARRVRDLASDRE